MNRILSLCGLLLGCAISAEATTNDVYAVMAFGAKGDGKTDDTSAIQRALDAVGKAGGGIVYAPCGNYFLARHLNVPSGVMLKGVWESVPSHIGLRSEGPPKPTDDGTTYIENADAVN